MSLQTEEPVHANQHRPEKRTQEVGQQSAYDIVCVGFGAGSLPLAASLADSNTAARVLFLERDDRFTWNPESLLPDKEVGTSFLRDLTTTQNPRSAFTFMNYLHETGQIVRFANNSRLAPSRQMMGHYFRWAATSIQQLGWVQYGQEAIRIVPVKAARRVVKWAVLTRNTTTGAIKDIQTKRVIIATGRQPHIPTALAAPQLDSLVVHASRCARVLAKATDSKLSIAIIGADQEAAEIFEDLSKRRGQHTATLFVEDSALRPEGSVLEQTGEPSSMLPPEIRQSLRSEDSISPKVSLAMLESLYLMRYTQQIAQRDASKWRFQIKTLSDIVEAKQEQGKIRLVTRNPRTSEMGVSAQTFDMIIAATGYDFAVNKQLIAPFASLLDSAAMTVDRKYRVNFRREILARDCGVWMIGSLGDANQRGDDFSVMAERSHRIAKCMLEQLSSDVTEGGKQYEHAVL